MDISNLRRQPKFKTERSDDDRNIYDRKTVVNAAKQLKLMVCRLIQERGRTPYLTLVLGSVDDKMKEIKQVWELLQNQLEQAEKNRLRHRRVSNEIGAGDLGILESALYGWVVLHGKDLL